MAAFELALRHLAGRVTEADPVCVRLAMIERRHIEDFKVHLAARPGKRGRPISSTTIRHRLGLLRTFFERIIEWDYADAPSRVPIYAGDLPKADDPLPRFLDDETAARFMAALGTDPDPRRRLMVELLARTGMRVGEVGALAENAMVLIGDNFWLRVPVGKLHNDRYVPLHPILVDLITDYRARRGKSRSGHLLERNDGQPYDRRTIHRYVAASARRAGVGHVYPHQLRHTLATQAINHGMSLEAIAALLGHRSMRMTLVYARISDRSVADQYFAVTAAVEAAYQRTAPPADAKLVDGHPSPGEPCDPECSCEPCAAVDAAPSFGPGRSRARSQRSTGIRPAGST